MKKVEKKHGERKAALLVTRFDRFFIYDLVVGVGIGG